MVDRDGRGGRWSSKSMMMSVVKQWPLIQWLVPAECCGMCGDHGAKNFAALPEQNILKLFCYQCIPSVQRAYYLCTYGTLHRADDVYSAMRRLHSVLVNCTVRFITPTCPTSHKTKPDTALKVNPSFTALNNSAEAIVSGSHSTHHNGQTILKSPWRW